MYIQAKALLEPYRGLHKAHFINYVLNCLKMSQKVGRGIGVKNGLFFDIILFFLFANDRFIKKVFPKWEYHAHEGSIKILNSNMVIFLREILLKHSIAP